MGADDCETRSMLARMSSMSDLRREWFPAPSDVTAAYAAKHRIADNIRSVIERLVSADVDGVDAGELEALETTAAVLRRQIQALPDLRRNGSLAKAPLPDGALVERSPVSGRGNALAIPLEYVFDGETTRASAVFSLAYEGPPGGVHGGYIAAAFDELLGVAQMVTGFAGFTGTLTVRYHALTPVGRRIDYEAGPGGRDGRKLTMWARATADGKLVAEAEGLFITQVAIDEDAGNLWTDRG